MNNKKALVIFIALGVIFTILGATFAYWNWTSTNAQKTNVTFTVGANFSCSADGGGTITNTNYFIPTECTNSTYAIKREITTSITGSPVYMDMWLNINSIGSGLSSSNNFKYALTTSSSSCTTGVVSQGNFNGKVANDKIQLLDDVSSAGTYYLYIWLDAAETSSSTQNQSVSLSLGGECTDEEPNFLINELSQNAVMDNIVSTYVTNSYGVQFGAISSDTNGKGIYIRSGTENTAHPIYYYRGAVTDNNLLFAGFCWKIVRTTDTGGIKLVYNGLPSGTNNDQCTNPTEVSVTYSKFNDNSTSPANVGYMYGTRYDSSLKPSSELETPYLFGQGFTYSNGTYTLTNTMISTGTWNTDYSTLNNNHYTCFNTTGTCESIYYIYDTYIYGSPPGAHYITITNGKSISDALSEMLTNSTNVTSSAIKTVVDTWYQANMTSYISMLEDTPWCNDRRFSVLNGLDPDGGDTTVMPSLVFNAENRANSTLQPSLTCTKNDAFTVNETSVGNGDLTYPVGLLTSDEIMLAGGQNRISNSTYYLYVNDSWWTLSPSGFDDVYGVRSTGYLYSNSTTSERGVRPSVSLKPGTVLTGGDGTSMNPYTVE